MPRFVEGVALVLAIQILSVSAALGCVAIPGQECPRSTPFLVFFDWNSDHVPADRLPIIELVAKQWKASEQARSAGDARYFKKLTVDGYTDRSLSPAGSLDLSVRMAQHVADVLVKLGVDRKDIVFTAHGEQDPRVPTGPGIREPQNRRVEIWFEN
jgi:OmpA-OmpF porin, OOP family